jgi:tRNA pseudouridine synthase 10
VDEGPAFSKAIQANLLASIVAACEPFEFRTFLLSSRIPASLDPDAARKMKRELHSSLATQLFERWPGREPDFLEPEARILLDLETSSVRLETAPLFVSGRYRKFDRELPQSRWPCRYCSGRGCPRCRPMGKTYADTLEDTIAAPLLRACRGSGSRFHAVGREDIDARMLGSGRPFVLELRDPEKRSLDAVAVERETNASQRQPTWSG